MKLIAAIIVVALACDLLAAPQKKLNLRGIPFYQIYEEKDIGNSSSSNFITTAPDGRLFFGCENGIHSFDGTSWKHLLETPSTREKIRCIAWTPNGVFAAGYGTIGKLDFTGPTGIRFDRLNPLPLTDYNSEYYSKIHQQGQILYFIGQRSVAYLDLENMEYAATSFDSWVKGSTIHQGTLLVATTRDGIVVFDGFSHSTHPAFTRFNDKHVILEIESSESGEIYFTTESKEIYRIPAGEPIDKFTRFAFEAEGVIRDLEFVEDNKLAISVAHKGIYFVNRQGDILSTLERDHDYRWVGSNSLHLDENKTLWVQFNSTVGKVIIDSPVSQIDERLSMGVEYPIAHEAGGKVWIRTNGRLLEPAFTEFGSLKGFKDSTPGLDRSVVAAVSTKEELYFQAGDSTFILENGNHQNLGKTGFIERMVLFEGDPNRFFASTPDSLILMHREKDEMIKEDQILHRAGHINKIARSSKNVFWLEIGIGQIGRAWVENGRIKYQLLTQENGLPSDWVAVWEHEGEVLFTSRAGIYEFIPSLSKFRKTHLLEAYLPSEDIFHRVATDPSGNIWASHEKFNYILWKQADGSYKKDAITLSQLGDQYFNQFKFLSNGDAILLTANELFHIDGERLKEPFDSPKRNLFLFEISDIEGSSNYYINSGFESTPKRLEFASDRRNLTFRAGDTNSATTKPPLYQYFLEGMSQDWSKWSTSNEVNFTKLDAGEFTLRIRARPNESVPPEEISIVLFIEPTLFETPLAYLTYVTAFGVVLYFGYNHLAKNLKHANLKLESMVEERTKEIESKNDELRKNASELTYALEELGNAQDLLMCTSRKAGMAEVATNVLHNVGNVLNSINVALMTLSERLSQERVKKLVLVSQMINAHRENLAEFLTNDPKGRSIPAYLTQLSKVLADDNSHYQLEVECMQENIEHVKKIITTQQTHAKTVEVLQTFKIEKLFDDALEMTTGNLEYSFYEVVRDFEPDLEIETDKHSLLQMITNFIKNAKESIIESGKPLGLITLSAKTTANKENIRIQISDNGLGISEENERMIFTHGFTTKSDGHGFGMHSCANAAKKLGGSLHIKSEGIGSGATVTLVLPVSAKSKYRPRTASELTSYSRN
ncbi:ATP-binding protein [Pelagicoccus sp. SDUM812002]|uniref:ATP-binding protein n=1 Tax=Pelagicoccus sp. SDUM812002 TaxID=3041266 RepID=UPI00280CC64F|nr:ATP-binding protein [Pelagicoccus sp. SDUM812002]MDQ8185363.1 ATP-binding protein [Pelagicoccus sp. SDUM812002]